MGTWNSRGLRGSTLEDMVNRTNEWYLEKNLALMQKIPTPITPVRMDKEHRQITLAYFDQRQILNKNFWYLTDNHSTTYYHQLVYQSHLGGY
mgnify:CR=1 FL=1